MDKSEVQKLLLELENDSIDELNEKFLEISETKGKVLPEDIKLILKTLKDYEVDFSPLEMKIEQKLVDKEISYEMLKRFLKKYLNHLLNDDIRSSTKTEKQDIHSEVNENTLGALEQALGLPNDIEKESNTIEKENPNNLLDAVASKISDTLISQKPKEDLKQDFNLITEVKNQSSDDSSSSSPEVLNKGLAALPDYQLKKQTTETPKKKEIFPANNPKKKLESPKKSIFSLPPSQKVIRYKFEDLTFPEFKKRLESNSSFLIEKIGKTPVKQLLVDLMSQCRIVPKPEEVQIFSKEVKVAQSEKSEPLSIDIFKSLCEKWYNEVHFPKDFKSKLILSIKEYETMKSKMMPSDDPSFIDSLITTLKTHLRKIIETSTKQNISSGLEDRVRAGCHEVFQYYLKNPQQDLKKRFEVIDQQRFLKFCQDFSILLKHKNPDKNRIKQETLEEIYLNNSNPKGDMHEYQFTQALERLGFVFFDEEYDFQNKTHWRVLADDAKVVKFFEVLGFHESSIYARKMKGSKYSDLNSVMKYSFDLSKSNFTPKGLGKGDEKHKPVKKEKPVTWDQLAGSPEDDQDLRDLINEDSSEEEGPKRFKKMNKGENTISSKIMQRAEELAKRENDKLQSLMRLADNRSEKQINLSKKFRK